jgi:hypothetical protein
MILHILKYLDRYYMKNIKNLYKESISFICLYANLVYSKIFYHINQINQIIIIVINIKNRGRILKLILGINIIILKI